MDFDNIEPAVVEEAEGEGEECELSPTKHPQEVAIESNLILA